jgi:Sec7-like guanine-nucleotide exchange factor
MIAEFMLATPGLSKFAIGQYLGKRDDFHIEVLKAFCNKIDFTGMEIDEAMRLFLGTFRLPGEG